MWKALRIVLAIAIVLAIVMVFGSVQTFQWLHARVRDYLGDSVGGDPAVAWLIAAGAFCIVYLVPWRSLVFSSMLGRAKSLVTLAVACFAGAGALKLAHSRLPFDAQGNPVQSWIETAAGPVILDLPPGGIDRRSGLRRQPLTVEMLRSIEMEKNLQGKQPDTNRYFNARDGRNKVWFSVDGCEPKERDGYDDRGRRLVPATAEKVEACEKQRAEEERRREEQASQQERRTRRAERAARIKEFREIGRYVARGRGHFVTIDGLRLFLEECLILKDEAHLKFRMVNVPDEQAAGTTTNASFEFDLVGKDGTRTRATGLRRVQGAVGVSSDGKLIPPGPDEQGWFVVEFARDSEAGAFMIMINNATRFSRPADHIARVMTLR